MIRFGKLACPRRKPSPKTKYRTTNAAPKMIIVPPLSIETQLCHCRGVVARCDGPGIQGSSFSKLARRSLALRPAHSRGHQTRDRYPKASDISSPPCLLRLLPAGAVAGWALHPLEKRRLVTAHVENGHSVIVPKVSL